MTIMSITKEKPIGDASIQSSQLDGIPVRVAHQLHDAFQIRSASFQVYIMYRFAKLSLVVFYEVLCLIGVYCIALFRKGK